MASREAPTERIFRCTYCYVRFTRRVNSEDALAITCPRSCSQGKAVEVTEEWRAQQAKRKKDRLERAKLAEIARKETPQPDIFERRAKQAGLSQI